MVMAAIIEVIVLVVVIVVVIVVVVVVVVVVVEPDELVVQTNKRLYLEGDGQVSRVSCAISP